MFWRNKMADSIKIKKKDASKGEDGYKVFSVRIKEETVTKLDQLAAESSHSRNHIINMFLEFGLEHYEIID